MDGVRDCLLGKKVVVTGAGSVGTELVDQLLQFGVGSIRVVDNNETGLFRFQEHVSTKAADIEILYCDIREEHEINRAFSGMDYCFHTAALKHVPFCEHSPFSAVQNNIIGAQQIIRAALRNHLTRVLLTSSDKAVNPTNVMGTSKLMAERLWTAANALSEGNHRCVFSATRFGNVAGSQGSVIPLFVEQIRAGRDITLTDPRMSRFIMTIGDAARMVIETMAMARGGEIFITKMPVLNIGDLVRVMVRMIAPLYGRQPESIRVREVGPRPGEKMWEELNTDEEVRRTFDLGNYLVVLPAMRNFYGDVDYQYAPRAMAPCGKIYHSSNETPMTSAEIEDFLLQPGVLPDEVSARLGVKVGGAA